MKKYILLLFTLSLLSISMSAQVMPDIRIPNPEESRLIQKTNGWHTSAISSTICTAGFLAVSGIYTIEKSEAEFANKFNTDNVIIKASLMLAGASAFLATVSWTEYSKNKRKLGNNKLLLKTVPSGLIIEF